MMSKIGSMLNQAFLDMKDSAKAQHEVDKANFEAAKAEAKANFEEAKASSSIQSHKEKMQKKREEQIVAAKKRTKHANERVTAVHKEK